jgi:hypothetical protein
VSTGSRDLRPLYKLLAAVFVVWLLSLVLTWKGALTKWEESAAFGDSFGAINALFAGLAFAGIVYTILIQRDELALQREELQLQRQELRGQREQLEAQNSTFLRQNFDSAFFQMLALHHRIVESMSVRAVRASAEGGIATFGGRDCFTYYYRLLTEAVDKRSAQSLDLSSLHLVQLAYMNVYIAIGPDIGPYFRNLYSIMKYVDGHSEVDQRFYTNLVRAQLSGDELVMLFYNCVSSYGVKFKPLIEKYALLKHLAWNALMADEHMGWYSPEAYRGAGHAYAPEPS